MNKQALFLPAPFLRRLAAMLYDSLLIIPILMLVTLLWLIANGGETIRSNHPFFLPMQISLLLSILVFYIYFWLHGGQTLGMRAWRLRIQQVNGTKITLPLAIKRALFAILSLLCAGLGIFWMLIPPAHKMWHDIFSQTEVILLPKKPS